ncbi:cilia- and flagella-associated protein 144-like [Clytia hemisphaerica]|eukprot:TCONS_00052960-protein
MATKKEAAPVNYVHQTAINLETIKKEQKNQKIYTNYSINPFKKMYTLSGKPNSLHDSADGEEDDDFLQVIKRANQTPVEKFEFPQTEAQEIGWCTKPLIVQPKDDARLHHPKKHSEITKFMDAYWRQKEQSENLN